MLKGLVLSALMGLGVLGFASTASADTVVQETVTVVVVEEVAPTPPPPLPVETVVVVRRGWQWHRSWWYWNTGYGWRLHEGYWVRARRAAWYGPRYYFRPHFGWVTVRGHYR